MNNMQLKLGKEESQIIYKNSTKQAYISPKITQLIMNEVVKGGASAAFNEAHSGLMGS